MTENDEKFEQLQYLSFRAMRDAQKCFEYGVFIGKDEYVLRLNELLQCMPGIKTHNFEMAKETLLNGIIDLNFAFGKTYFNGADLNNITQ